MKEEILHFVWKLLRFDLSDLRSISDKSIQIINKGIWNHRAGPDFLNAAIKIGDTMWHGSVEIHVNSSDWFRHKHQLDIHYNNVILHVVYKHDKDVFDSHKRNIETLELKDRIHPSTLDRYAFLNKNYSSIPCRPLIPTIDDSFIKSYMQSLLVNRLQRKYLRIYKLLTTSKFDWEFITVSLIAQYLGAPSNKEAFRDLLERTPLKIINACRHNLFKLEALLLGQSGLLRTGKDTYVQKLCKEYKHLQRKHNLKAMTGTQWNFGKLHPVAFPSRRIALLSSILYSEAKLFATLISKPELSAFKKILRIEFSDYWREHYRLDRPSKRSSGQAGSQLKNQLIINAFIPICFSYAKTHDNEALMTHCLHLYSRLKPEKNTILKKWQSIGIKSNDAGESQALLELNQEYCEHLKCLNCQIGTKLLFE